MSSARPSPYVRAFTAADIAKLIEQCAAHKVTKFQVGPAGEVSIQFQGYREPLSAAANTLEQLMLPEAGDPWMTQTIQPNPLPPEVD